MAISNLSVDPPVGSGITVSATLTNTGQRSITAFSYCIASISDVLQPSIDDVVTGSNLLTFTPIGDFFDAISSPESFTLAIPATTQVGLNVIPAGGSRDISFTIQTINTPGIYDVALQAGEFSGLPADVTTQEIIEVQDSLVVEDGFEIFIPAEVELSNVSINPFAVQP